MLMCVNVCVCVSIIGCCVSLRVADRLRSSMLCECVRVVCVVSPCLGDYLRPLIVAISRQSEQPVRCWQPTGHKKDFRCPVLNGCFPGSRGACASER